MRAKLSAVCLGIEEKTFVKKDTGEVIAYRKAKFSTRGTTETFSLEVPLDFDVASLIEYQDAKSMAAASFLSRAEERA